MSDTVVDKSLSADGRQVILYTDGHSEFWDDSDHLFTVPHRVSEQAAEMYLQVYDQGFEHGKTRGRTLLQYEIQKALGVKP